MRLVYIYIDFTFGGKNPDGYRNYKKCGLNFGTEYYFNMSEPSEDKPNYELKCSARPAGERIEPGFWGNDRLYNISALVGDNGVGKTTLIHEIIRCLLGDSIKGNAGNSLFAIIMQDNDGEYYLQHSLSKPIRICMDFSNGVISDALCRLCDRCKQHASNESKQDDGQLTHRLISETKLIYFSNTLTQSDKNLFETTNNLNPNGYPGNSQYILPLYNCSLTADIINAMRTSEVFDASIDNHLETYFNFRSYQEARYVFDRNQRKILLGLKEESGLPVPLPNSLTLMIPSVIGHLCSVIYEEDESRTILCFMFFSRWRLYTAKPCRLIHYSSIPSSRQAFFKNRLTDFCLRVTMWRMNTEMKRLMSETIREFRLPRYRELPDMGLYLEQTVKYLNTVLAPLGCLEITASMVSNYVKKGIIAKPVKKQYYAEQIAYLFFVVVAKNQLSMEERMAKMFSSEYSISEDIIRTMSTSVSIS